MIDFLKHQCLPASKTIVQFWDDGSPPEGLAQRMAKWRQLNRTWRYELYDTESAAAYIETNYGPEISGAFLSIRMPAMKADVFRVARLLTGSGLWVDSGTICGAPLHSWLDRKAGLVLMRRPGMEPPVCWNGVIYVHQTHHPFLDTLWERISACILAREGTSVWHQTGPGLYRDIFGETDFLEQATILQLEDLDGLVEYGSSSHFLPVETHWSKRQAAGESLYV